jgi:hypothetical protein
MLLLPKLKAEHELKTKLLEIFDTAVEFYVAKSLVAPRDLIKQTCILRAWRYARFHNDISHTSVARVKQLQVMLDALPTLLPQATQPL